MSVPSLSKITSDIFVPSAATRFASFSSVTHNRFGSSVERARTAGRSSADMARRIAALMHDQDRLLDIRHVFSSLACVS